MNHYNAFPSRNHMGTWWAMVRICRDAEPSPVLDKQGKPKPFKTRGEAAEECLKHIVAFMNGNAIRGEVFEGADYSRRAVSRSKAEGLFRKKEAAA